jgi:hypothetical protein
MPPPAAASAATPVVDNDSHGETATTLLLRRPLLLLLVLGFAVSLFASGRFTLRLIVDGALSFAFLPVCQILGLAAVYPFRARRALSFPAAVDRFCAGNTAWLWWMTVVMVTIAVVPVLNQPRLFSPLLVSMLVPILCSVAIDVRFFGEAFGHTGWRAALDIAIERLVAWSAWWIYFFGAASDWRLGDTLYIFVEAWDMLRAWAAS